MPILRAEARYLESGGPTATRFEKGMSYQKKKGAGMLWRAMRENHEQINIRRGKRMLNKSYGSGLGVTNAPFVDQNTQD